MNGAQPLATDPSIAIEAAMGVARANGEYDMATIGTFTATSKGEFTGVIKTEQAKWAEVIKAANIKE